jgi:DNA topoisomerase-1
VRQTQILTQSDSVYWQAKGQVIQFAGYSKYWNNLSADIQLPTLRQSQALTLQQAAHESKQTQPPPRYSEPKLVQVMERIGIGRPSTYAPTIGTLKQRTYVELNKGHLQPTVLGLEVDRFLQDALPDLLEAEFTAQMEQALDQIAAGKQNWEIYLTTWNREYFSGALAKARQVIPTHLTTNRVSGNQQPLNLSRTRCPGCQNYLAKIPSSKLKKKYFLKCVDGCENVVLFWSDHARKWEPPRHKAETALSTPPLLLQLSAYACPVCQKPMEEYSYDKDGQSKRLLRCSDPQARSARQHKQAVYFQTPKGWWSPKFGELH